MSSAVSDETSPAQTKRGPTILVSAFEPFGGASVNASQEVARCLEGQTVSVGIGDAAQAVPIETFTVPVIAGEAERIVFERLRNGPRPLAYIALGEAGPQRVVRLEKVYINWDDFRICDNGGNQPRDTAIVPNAPDAYFATLDFFHADTVLTGDIPVPTTLSLTAGAFLCNHVSYQVSHFYAENPRFAVPFGFIHVPSWRPENGESDLQAITETVRRVIVSLSFSANMTPLPPNNGGF